MPQEGQNDNRNDNHFLDQCCFQVVDGTQYQFRPVIGADDLHTGRKARLKFMQPRFHAFNNGQRVLALPDDHNAGRRVALPVPIGNAAPQVGPKQLNKLFSSAARKRRSRSNCRTLASSRET